MFGPKRHIRACPVFSRCTSHKTLRKSPPASTVLERLMQKVKKLFQKSDSPEMNPDINIHSLFQRPRKAKGEKLNETGRLMRSMTPLAHLPYERQLEIKEEMCKSYELKMRNVIQHSGHFYRNNLHPDLQKRLAREDTVFNIPKLIPSPVSEDYRNKDYPVIGPGVDGKPTVGFYIVPGKFPNMDIGLGKLKSMKQQHFETMKAFTECVRSSGIPAFGQCCHDEVRVHGGHWKSLLVRSNCQGDLLVAANGVQYENPDLPKRMQEILLNFFLHGGGRNLNVKSLHFQERPYIRTDLNRYPFHLLHGSPVITERLHDLSFTVSPGSFFQINTAAAEILYEKVRDLCQLRKDTVLLDLCCGTGTIGMILSKYVKLVVGIEENKPAVQDAIKSAALNNVDNIAFISGTIEKRLPDFLKRVDFTSTQPDVVAVVNPPRAGLGAKFIRTLRNCEEIKKVVYISCKPYGVVVKNFLGLVQPANKPDEKITGPPFTITETAAVDMFPQTKHFELLLLFER